MLISGKFCCFSLYVKSFKNALLEHVSEYLDVSINNEFTPNTIEDDAAAWPVLVFELADCDAGRNFGRLPYSPLFPYVIVPVWTSQKTAIFLGAVERAQMRQKHGSTVVAPNEPKWAHAAPLNVVYHPFKVYLILFWSRIRSGNLFPNIRFHGDLFLSQMGRSEDAAESLARPDARVSPSKKVYTPRKGEQGSIDASGDRQMLRRICDTGAENWICDSRPHLYRI